MFQCAMGRGRLPFVDVIHSCIRLVHLSKADGHGFNCCYPIVMNVLDLLSREYRVGRRGAEMARLEERRIYRRVMEMSDIKPIFEERFSRKITCMDIDVTRRL